MRGAALRSLAYRRSRTQVIKITFAEEVGGGWENTVNELPNPDLSTTPPPLPGALDRVADPEAYRAGLVWAVAPMTELGGNASERDITIQVASKNRPY